MTEVTRVRVETPVMHTVRVFEPQPVKVSVLVGGTPLDPADFATAVQGALADTAVQPGDIPIEIWNVETIVDGTYPDNEGIPDQSAVGGPTLVEGDRVLRIRNDGTASVYAVAAGAWTLIHDLAIGDHAQVTWGGFTGEFTGYNLVLGCLVDGQFQLVNIGIVMGLQGQIDPINTYLDGLGDIVTHDASEFATAAQGDKADTALQPGETPIEIWNVRSPAFTETFEGIEDQSAYGGPTLVAGDRVVAVPNGGLALVYEVAEGPWTLIHTAAVGDHFQITWDQFTGFYGLFSCALFVQTESGGQFVNQGYLSNLSGQATDLSNRIDALGTASAHAAEDFIPATDKGAAGGVAELDGSGFVVSTQLPSYVDDVVEYANFAAFPITGTSGIIYISQATNITYRWSGSIYSPIGSDLALGETMSTAYRGDRGKTAYDHSQIVTGNPHGTAAADMPVDASGFVNNLTPDDDTVQKVADKVDTLSAGGYSPSFLLGGM